MGIDVGFLLCFECESYARVLFVCLLSLFNIAMFYVSFFFFFLASDDGSKYYAIVYMYECLRNVRFTVRIYESFKLPLFDSNFMPDVLI